MTPASITFAANTLMTCPAAAPTCTAARAGTQGGSLGNNNWFAMTHVDVDWMPGTFNSSSADLSLPADALVLWAGLYWAADTATGSGGAAAPSPAARNTVSLRVPGAGAYATITAQTLDTNGSRLSSFADVTNQVRAAGVGAYTVANVQAGTGVDRYAAWDLIVVYRDATQPPRNLTVFDDQPVDPRRDALLVGLHDAALRGRCAARSGCGAAKATAPRRVTARR